MRYLFVVLVGLLAAPAMVEAGCGQAFVRGFNHVGFQNVGFQNVGFQNVHGGLAAINAGFGNVNCVNGTCFVQQDAVVVPGSVGFFATRNNQNLFVNRNFVAQPLFISGNQAFVNQGKFLVAQNRAFNKGGQVLLLRNNNNFIRHNNQLLLRNRGGNGGFLQRLFNRNNNRGSVNIINGKNLQRSSSIILIR